MRLLVVSHFFWPENFRINDLCSELVARGHQVTVLTGVPNYPEGKVFADFQKDRQPFGAHNGAAIVRVPMVPRGSSRLQLIVNYITFAISASIVGSWRLRGRKFDVIFVYAPSPVTVGIPAVVQRALKGAPVMFWVLDLWPETLEAIGIVRSRSVLKVIGLLVSFLYARCALILAQSRSFIPQIEKYCKQDRRIVYFPSWAEPVFGDSTGAPAPEIPVSPDVFNVMFAGNIGEAQDFPAILAAAELLRSNKHIRWLFVGDGRMANWVKKEIERRHLADCVFMLGRYPLERMPSFYRHANALLVSLKDEPIFSLTIPGKLQSYLKAGVPIVAMLNGEGADVVARLDAGLTCPAGDSDALAAAVLRLASMPVEERFEMGRRASVAAASEFDRSILISRFEHWCRELRPGTA